MKYEGVKKHIKWMIDNYCCKTTPVSESDFNGGVNVCAVYEMDLECAAGLLKEAKATLKHARVFIGSRQRMHGDGLELYDELVENISKYV